MSFAWTLPVYRPPVWLETLIHNEGRYAQDGSTRLLSGIEPITKWLEHECRDFVSAFPVTISLSVLWILLSYFQTWKTRKAANRAVRENVEAAIASLSPTSSPTPSPSPEPCHRRTTTTVTADDTPTRTLYVTPVCTPTARLRNQTAFSSPSTTGAHVPIEIHDRTGSVITPGYQTQVA